MTALLMVPMRVDALYLSKSEPAAEPTADFRHLPFFDSDEGRDVNSDTPWLGDTVASPPFENSNITLQAGMHLHWSLPDGLCHGKVDSGRGTGGENTGNLATDSRLLMPTVPNRWLIRRRNKSVALPERQWVIESDYLWPEQEQAPAINIFHVRDNSRGRPYRFLGRKLTVSAWESEQTLKARQTDEYLENLTALGHGEPTFSAYYQNCMSVFGFHDAELARLDKNKTVDVNYDIVGWYGTGTQAPEFVWNVDVDDKASMIESTRRWRIASKITPEQLVCYSSIQIKAGSVAKVPSSDVGKYKVAIGNTASEALCALLAREVAEDMKSIELSQQIEEQLEALNIEGQLASESQDRGLRLRRYRHQKSFVPVPGSELWTVQSDQPDKGQLSDTILSSLRQLNACQARYARQIEEHEQARRQLYADWCNYMRCVYRPPDGGRGQYLDIDEIVAYIEERSLARVQRLSGIVETSKEQLDSAMARLQSLVSEKNDEELSKPTMDPDDSLTVGQATTSEVESRATQYTVRSISAARHWRPTDPVILMTGGKVQLGERHGRDSRLSSDDLLSCRINTISEDKIDEKMKTNEGRSDLLGWVKKQKNTRNMQSIGIQTIQEQRPWNPLFLDWGIDLHPAESRKADAPGSYDSDVITDNYTLGNRNPDLQPDILWTDDNPDRFSGRCILGGTSSIVMRERIEDVLQRRILDGEPEDWAGEDETSDYFKKTLKWNSRADKPTKLPSTPAELQSLVKWYKARPLKTKDNSSRNLDPLFCTLLAYQKLFDNAKASASEAVEPLQPRAFLNQSLGGFSEELLQWKPALTLPIDEPIGLKPYREFTRRVAAAVGRTTEWAPEPTNTFSPLRSGALKLDSLRLIDSFGQVEEVPVDHKVIVPAPYRLPARPGVAFLPPRLVQPARISFRWLDASPDIADEMLEEAARSPICGWLLPERLNGRLLVFAGDGSPLGALASDKNTTLLEWVRAPGLNRLSDDECAAGRVWLNNVSVDYYQKAAKNLSKVNLRDLGEMGASIDNRRLARVLLYLWATRSSEFLTSFLNTLDDAMANIDPEGTTSMGAMALLMGRPVAVIGAELNLQLKDKPAVRQDWTAFMLDQYRHRRDTEAFEDVNIPLRLGQFQSRNDGVLGYWREESDRFTNDTFVAQAADDNDSRRPLELKRSESGKARQGLAARINAHDLHDRDDGLNFTQSVSDRAMRATLLFDPRGRAHLTSGILPVKSIDIPRQLWEPALESIRVWFPTGPVLSPPTQRRVPTPVLVERQWSWLERTGNSKTDEWQTIRMRPSISRNALTGALNEMNDESSNEIIVELIAKGWLEEGDPASERLNLGTREERRKLDDQTIENSLDLLLTQLSLTLVEPDESS